MKLLFCQYSFSSPTKFEYIFILNRENCIYKHKIHHYRYSVSGILEVVIKDSYGFYYEEFEIIKEIITI